MQTVIFKLGKEEYAFDILDVKEIVRTQEITILPNLPVDIDGVINLRGDVIPILNLALKFNLEVQAENQSSRFIVLNLREDKLIAIRADEVTEVLRIDDNVIDSDLKVSGDNCLKGIANLDDRLILLLDSNKLIDIEELSYINNLESN